MTNTLLIIDDERDFAEFVAKVAAKSGFEVTVTDSAEAFMDSLRTPPSVVVIDLQMPGTDGIELLRELAGQGIVSKVVMASGIDARTIDTACRLGRELGLSMAGVIRKPIRAAELQQMFEGLRGAPRFEATADGIECAIGGDELFPLFQPKIEIASGRCVGAEMLIRWREPCGTVVMPDQFVPLAERAGLIDELTDWVLRHGITQAAAWHEKGLRLKLALNVSATNLHDATLPDRAEAMCRAVNLPPSALVLELTETATMRDTTRLMEVLARLRIKGFELSIDDFGTGYSSLVQLYRLPFTEIKIDQSFVTVMDLEAQVIARTITQMGHALGLTVVAEGVETLAALKLLAEFGTDLAQGYLLSRPISADDIPDFVAARSSGQRGP